MWIRLAVHRGGRVRFLTVPFKRSMPVRQDNATLLSPSPWLRSTHIHTLPSGNHVRQIQSEGGRGEGGRGRNRHAVLKSGWIGVCVEWWGEIPTHSDQTLLACGNTLIVLLCRTYFIYFGNCKIHVNVKNNEFFWHTLNFWRAQKSAKC